MVCLIPPNGLLIVPQLVYVQVNVLQFRSITKFTDRDASQTFKCSDRILNELSMFAKLLF